MYGVEKAVFCLVLLAGELTELKYSRWQSITDCEVGKILEWSRGRS